MSDTGTTPPAPPETPPAPATAPPASESDALTKISDVVEKAVAKVWEKKEAEAASKTPPKVDVSEKADPPPPRSQEPSSKMGFLERLLTGQ